MLENRESHIIDFIKKKGASSSKEILDGTDIDVSYATLKRILANLTSEGYLVTTGRGKSTKYVLSTAFEMLRPVDLEKYYKDDIDDREIREAFNFKIISDVLYNSDVFSDRELEKLNQLQKEFESNIKELSERERQRELERLAIDLSWKSSQIEGNTYSLLETERLLKDRETAAGKTREEATMLLNHKVALDFIFKNRDYLQSITISKIEDIHSMLTRDLHVARNLRKRRIAISGTNYKPLDNEFQIKEALSAACEVIDHKDNVFEKALLSLVLISYIQPFMDGNKRTARIVSNAILINYGYCPLSFRTVSSIDYKKAMLLFYEQNNISSFKEIFIDQFEFAVKTYF